MSVGLLEILLLFIVFHLLNLTTRTITPGGNR